MQPYGYYPASYSGYNAYQTPQYQPQASQQQDNSIKWVQGIAGAKAYAMGAGQSVLLMDSESNAFYIKSTDSSGMPLPLRIFDYTERNAAQGATTAPQTASIDTSIFVTHEELEARIAQICAPTTKRTVTKKAEVEDGK